MANFDGFENVQTTFNTHVEVIGISLDKSKTDCERLLIEKSPTHQQVYEGLNSQIAKDYRIVEIHIMFLLLNLRRKNIPQIDLFVIAT